MLSQCRDENISVVLLPNFTVSSENRGPRMACKLSVNGTVRRLCQPTETRYSNTAAILNRIANNGLNLGSVLGVVCDCRGVLHSPTPVFKHLVRNFALLLLDIWI